MVIGMKDVLIERAATALFRLAGALPVGLQRLAAGKPVQIDNQHLHPETQLILRLLDKLSGPTFDKLPLAQGRAQTDAEAGIFGGPPIPMAEVRELVLDGQVPTRFYRPYGLTAPAPLLVYFHGGGFVVGSTDSCDSVCRFLAQHSEVAVLSVNYRLAPEHKFPAAIEDGVAAFRHAVKHAGELGADPSRISVSGDSAGGNLAAVVSQVTVAEGGPAPAFQLLFFPWTDMSAKHRSYTLFPEGFFLTEAQMDWYRTHYLPDEHAALDPRASPLLAEDLTGLPPAYVAVAGFDVLRDEGIRYAERLREAGVPTALRVHRGLIHAFVNATGVGRAASAAMFEAAGALRVGLS